MKRRKDLGYRACITEGQREKDREGKRERGGEGV